MLGVIHIITGLGWNHANVGRTLTGFQPYGGGPQVGPGGQVVTPRDLAKVLGRKVGVSGQGELGEVILTLRETLPELRLRLFLHVNHQVCNIHTFQSQAV